MENIETSRPPAYRIQLERAASTKGVDGFKVEAVGDDIEKVKADAAELYYYTIDLTVPRTLTVSTPVAHPTGKEEKT